MSDMKLYDYIPVKHWWDKPANHPVAILVRAHGRLYLAASSVGAGLSTFMYWRTHSIPRRYWISFERQGVTRKALEDHEKDFRKGKFLSKKEYQRYYYVTRTIPKRKEAKP